MMMMMMMMPVQTGGEILLEFSVSGLVSFRNDGVIVGSGWARERRIIYLGWWKGSFEFLGRTWTAAIGLQTGGR